MACSAALFQRWGVLNGNNFTFGTIRRLYSVRWIWLQKEPLVWLHQSGYIISDKSGGEKRPFCRCATLTRIGSFAARNIRKIWNTMCQHRRCTYMEHISRLCRNLPTYHAITLRQRTLWNGKFRFAWLTGTEFGYSRFSLSIEYGIWWWYLQTWWCSISQKTDKAIQRDIFQTFQCWI